MFNVGDKILIISDLECESSVHEKTVTKVMKDCVQCGSPEEVYYTAFCWPARVKEQLLEIIRQRAILKKAYDDSMGLVYELKNKMARNEI